MDIERRLRLLARGALTTLCFFLIAFLVVQGLIRGQQTADETRLTPIRTAIEELDGALDGLRIRQSRLASARGTAEVDVLVPRDELVARLEAGREHLRAIELESEDRANAENLDRDLDRFLALDANFADAIRSDAQGREKLARSIRSVEADLKSFLELAQGISGKMRFAHGSALRKIRRDVAARGYDEATKNAIEAELLISSARLRGFVGDVLALSGELNRLAGKIGLVQTNDQMRSLIANELTPTHEGLNVALDELAFEMADMPELRAMTEALDTQLVLLALRILAADNPESLIAQQESLLEGTKKLARISEDLGAAGREQARAFDRLVASVAAESKRFSKRLSQVVSVGGWMFAVLTIGALLAGLAADRQLRSSIAGLRSQNDALSTARQELTRANQDLEAKVEERTRTIRTILDHVKVGFFLCDVRGVVEAGHTRSCYSLLGTDRITGRPIAEILDLPQRQREDFELNLGQAFDDVLLEELVFDQMPSRFKVGDRALRFEGSSVRDTSGTVQGVLFSVVDITALEAAEERATANRTLLRLLKSREQFGRFLVSVHKQLQVAHKAVAAGDQQTVRRELHTVKGNLGLYGLTHAASIAHAVEEHHDISSGDIATVEASIKAFLEEHYAILGLRLGASSDSTLAIPANSLTELARAIHSPTSPEWLRDQVQAFLREVTLRPAAELVGPLEELSARLSTRFSKELDFVFEGSDVRLDPQRTRPVLEVLPHLIRNAIDHGIEEPWERGNKPPRARLLVQFSESPSSWKISVRDDGRGLPIDRLRKKARELQIVEHTMDLSEKDAIKMIFADNVSTAQNVTEVSGRGVGMSAVSSAVLSLGGRIDIDTAPGCGTAVHLEVPKDAST